MQRISNTFGFVNESVEFCILAAGKLMLDKSCSLRDVTLLATSFVSSRFEKSL